MSYNGIANLKPALPVGEAKCWYATCASYAGSRFAIATDIGYHGDSNEFKEWDNKFISRHYRDIDALRQLQTCWPYRFHPRPIEERTIWVNDEQGNLFKVKL